MTDKIAILIPCYNEEITIGKVVSDFLKALPKAKVYVYDNNSTDNTICEALKAGSIVRSERYQGKGNVVRRMFADIEADFFILCDGDDTYDAQLSPKLLSKLKEEGLDMLVATRDEQTNDSYRKGHRLGNQFFNFIFRRLFGRAFSDIFSGYRVFSRRFVKSFPCISTGFEIETELSVHALHLKMPTDEIRTPYGSRPAGSFSKLATYRDSFRILRVILLLLKEVKPLLFFSTVGFMLLIFSLSCGVPLIIGYLHTGFVPRLPTAILSVGLMMLSAMCFFSGLALDSVSRARKETKWLSYLSYSQYSKQDHAIEALVTESPIEETLSA